MSLLEEIRAMSPEEKAALSEALNDLEPKPEPEGRYLGNMRDPRYIKSNGEYMTEEEKYDYDHPLTGLWCYGTYDLIQVFGQPAKKKYRSMDEVDAHNKEIIDAWYEAKRIVFPNCLKPVITTRTIEG